MNWIAWKTGKVRAQVPCRVSNRERALSLVLAVFLLSACSLISDRVDPGADAISTSTRDESVTETRIQATGRTQQASPSPPPTEVPFPEDLPLAEVSYRLPLTLQFVDEESAIFYFELSEPVSGELILQDAEQGDSDLLRTPFEPLNGRHQIQLNQLQGVTSYRAMIVLEDGSSQPGFRGEVWGPLLFETSSEERGDLRIGLIGDASFGDAITTRLVEQLAAADLDFVIHAGDVVDVLENGRDPYEEYALGYYLPFAPLLTRMPVYTVPGNHDYDADILFENSPFYFTAFPSFEGVSRPENHAAENIAAYAFVRGGVQFLFLDSQVFYGAEGRASQDAWMEERLQDSSADATIVVFHIGPYSCSTVHPEDRIAVRDSWVYRLEAAQVPLVLSGHYHGYERAEENGITYIISAGGSEILYAQGAWLPQTRVAERVSHVVILEIQAGSLHLQAVSEDGEVIDQITLLIGEGG